MKYIRELISITGKQDFQYQAKDILFVIRPRQNFVGGICHGQAKRIMPVFVDKKGENQIGGN